MGIRIGFRKDLDLACSGRTGLKLNLLEFCEVLGSYSSLDWNRTLNLQRKHMNKQSVITSERERDRDVFTHTHIYIYICIYAYIGLYLNIHTYIHVSLALLRLQYPEIQLTLLACMKARESAKVQDKNVGIRDWGTLVCSKNLQDIYICMYIYIYVCMYVYIYIAGHT